MMSTYSFSIENATVKAASDFTRFSESTSFSSLKESTVVTSLTNVVGAFFGSLTSRTSKKFVGGTSVDALLTNFSPITDFHRSFGLNDASICELSDDDLVYPAYCSDSLDAISSYRSLEDGWDGEEAVAPLLETLDSAEFFLRVLGSNLSDAPSLLPMLDQDGIPGFFLDSDEKYLSMSFYGDHTLTYVYKDRVTSKRDIKTIDIFSPESISDLITYVESFGSIK